LEQEAEIIALEKIEAEVKAKLEEKGKILENVDEVVKESVKNYFIQVPSQEEIEKKIIEFKKKQLLDMYVSEEISKEEAEAKALLGLGV